MPGLLLRRPAGPSAVQSPPLRRGDEAPLTQPPHDRVLGPVRGDNRAVDSQPLRWRLADLGTRRLGRTEDAVRTVAAVQRHGVLSLAREKEWRFPEGPGYVSGTPVGDVGPPVLGPPDVAPGEFRFEWWRGNARAFVMLKAPLGFQLQNFAFESPGVGQGGSIRKMQAPHWALAAAAGLLPAARLARRLLDRWKRRAARGLCPACGYDQRASRDRCPECGTMTATLPTV